MKRTGHSTLMKGFGVASRLVGLRSFHHAAGEYRTGLNSSTAVSFRIDSEGRGPTPFFAGISQRGKSEMGVNSPLERRKYKLRGHGKKGTLFFSTGPWLAGPSTSTRIPGRGLLGIPFYLIALIDRS